jgi:hypothetical protein
MDPNANLAEQRRIIARLREIEKKYHVLDTVAFPSASYLQATGGDHDRLVELVEAMDEWLSKDGAFPDAWTHRETDPTP